MKRSLAIIALSLIPAAAAAQSPDPPIVQVRTAAGLSNFLHGDITGIAPTMRAAVRIGTGRFAIEPELGLAWLEKTDTFSGGTMRSFQDPGGGSVVQGFGGVAIRLW